MIAGTEKRNTVLAVVKLANPVFIVLAICLPIGLMLVALGTESLRTLNYAHIMTGAPWTGIDLFMGFVLGPVLGGLEPGERAAVFKRLMPKMTFLMPVLATVTLTTGFRLAVLMGEFSLSNPRVVVALALAAILTIQGFGMILPNEIRIFRQLLLPSPGVEKIARLGMRNAKYGGMQGLLQVAMIFVMATLRFG